ncbi:MAG: hypothetical protein KC900_11000 [Candidatus Omnitrophica bacterium]|nr:hypothetical protein [Candidatus Omnitrophota bacterium]
MTLTTIFFIMCGVCVVGIMVALWILQQEASGNAGIQKLSPDELKNYDPATETLKKRQGGTATQAPPKKSAKPKRPRVALQGLFGGQKGGESPVRLDAIEAAPDLPEDKPKKKSFLGKLSLRKSKPSPLDDIPRPTTFPGLHRKETEISSPGLSEGTAAMTTQKPPVSSSHLGSPPGAPPPPKPAAPAPGPANAQPVLPIEEEFQQTKSSAGGGQSDASSRQREHLATVQLDEWKQKYERLDKLFQEKSSQFAQAESQLANEKQNRDDFFKLKSILENEIQEVKDHARDLQHTLKNAQMETEQQKVQAQQLRDKVRILEEEIQRKNSQLKDAPGDARKDQAPPQSPPLGNLNEQNDREEAARKDGSPDPDPMVNLPQDQNPEAGANDGQGPAATQRPPVEGPQPPPPPGSDSSSEDKRF